jgi:protease I
MEKKLQVLAAEGNATDVMGIDTAALINGTDLPNQQLRALLEEEARPEELAGKKVAVVVTDGVEEIELTFVKKILEDRGAKVTIISPRKPAYPAMFATQVPEIRATHISTVKWMRNSGYIRIDEFLDVADPTAYALVFIPGGCWNPDVLRADKLALEFIGKAHSLGTPVAALCHGPWVLISAGLVKGRKVTSWWSMFDDLTNAGGIVVDEPVVSDDNIITARAPIDLAPLTREMIRVLKGQQ